MYKEISLAKLLKKACRSKRKGNEDDNEAQEGGKMYAVENLVSMDRMKPFVHLAKSAECKLALQTGEVLV